MGTLLAAEQNQVLPKAVKMAESWAKLPRATLVAWKKHSAARLEEKVRSVAVIAKLEEKAEEEAEDLAAAPRAIALCSKVVTATAYPEGIVVVKMEDREAKNMFSDAFMDGDQRGLCSYRWDAGV